MSAYFSFERMITATFVKVVYFLGFLILTAGGIGLMVWAGLQLNDATIDRNLGVDARAGALLIAELARRHIARGATWGRIVGLTSGGPGGFPQEVSYGAAKAALDNYTMSAATELADLGVTANIVHPPVTDTGWINDGVREFVARSQEHTYVATPDEVAAVIGWLCTDEAKLVSGTVMARR
jgi:3-oxoacyl-[acyl-carrier protein] reductase